MEKICSESREMEGDCDIGKNYYVVSTHSPRNRVPKEDR